MENQIDPVVTVLAVEPEMLAQLELCDTVRAAHARVDLACVSTCGGARQALEQSEHDVLLLSTSLCFFPDEWRALSELVHAARSRGLAIVALGPGNLEVARRLLRLPIHDTLSQQDIADGRMNGVLSGARSLASMDTAFVALVDHDRAALSARAMHNAHRAALQLVAEGQHELEASGTGPRLAAVLHRLRETLEYAAIPAEEPQRPSTRVARLVDEASACLNALSGAVRARHGYVDERGETAVEAPLLRHLLVRSCLALLPPNASPHATLVLSAASSLDEAVIEIENPSLPYARDGVRAFFEPFGMVGEDGMGLWAAHHLLSRWGARFELGGSPSGGTSLRIALPTFWRTHPESFSPNPETRTASPAGEVPARTSSVPTLSLTSGL